MALGDSLRRIAEVERQAERQFRENVTAQMQRDKVGVPKLSAEAAMVLEAVHAARTEQPAKSWYVVDTRNRHAVARAWETGRRNPTIEAEIDRFEKAAEQRLGVKRVLPPHCAVRTRAGPYRCQGSNPGKSWPCGSWRAAWSRHGAGAAIINCSARRTKPSSVKTTGSAPGTGRDRAWGDKFGME